MAAMCPPTEEMDVLGGPSDASTNAPAPRNYAKLVDLPQVSYFVLHRLLCARCANCFRNVQYSLGPYGVKKLRQNFKTLQTFTFDDIGTILMEQRFAWFSRAKRVQQRVSPASQRQASTPNHTRRPSPANNTREIHATDERPIQHI